MTTVLITDCLSGYGLETARHVYDHGWTVIATMRHPREGVLPASDHIRLLPLDVTSSNSIAAAVEVARPSDVLVSNAGIGVVGAFEATPMSYIRKVSETNTFGVMAMTQALIPQMRAPLGRDRERDLQRDAGADASRGCLHRKQAGHRRVHRVAGP